MSSLSTPTAPAGDHHGAAHDHPPHLAHHFDTPEQQFATGKLGMWVFLGTELLMFGGLFCAYAVFRHNHPEVFMYAHTYLDTWLGGINTVILLVSSFTMAWAVRAAQLGQKSLMGLLLGLTLLGGFGFMGIKAIEYHHKWEKHLFPGTMNKFNRAFVGDGTGDTGTTSAEKADAAPTAAPTPAGLPGGATPGETLPPSASAGTAEALDHARTDAAHAAAVPMIRPLVTDPHAGSGDAARIVPVSGGPAGLAGEYHGTAHGHLEFGQLAERDQLRVNTFFSIYFLMTGLHGLHVVVGMGLIAWIMIRGFGGAFGPSYYTPVDLVGLYWHLVDLIWIFLFPLLYLIH